MNQLDPSLGPYVPRRRFGVVVDRVPDALDGIWSRPTQPGKERTDLPKDWKTVRTVREPDVDRRRRELLLIDKLSRQDRDVVADQGFGIPILTLRVPVRRFRLGEEPRGAEAAAGAMVRPNAAYAPAQSLGWESRWASMAAPGGLANASPPGT